MLQIWTPMVQADTSSIARGVESFGRSVGEGMGDLARKMERQKQEDKERAEKAKQIRGMAKLFAKDLGLSPGDIETGDFNDLSGQVMGLMKREIMTAERAKADAAQEELKQHILQREDREAQRQLPAGILQAYAQRAGAGQSPDELMSGRGPLDEAGFDASVSASGPQAMNPMALAMLEAAARKSTALPPSLMEDILKGGRSEGPSMEMLSRLGFVPSGGQLNPNGTASLQFGPPAPPAPTTAKPLMTEGGQPTGKATFGDKVIDLSPPNSEGKTLTQSETQMLGALNQAEEDLSTLEKLFKDLGPDWGGPLSGRAKSIVGMGQNPNIAAVENAITAATPNLARGVFREVGVLTDEDIKRYKALLPTAYDTDAVRQVKMKQLRERIKQGKRETFEMLRKAGRDLSGFDKGAAPALPSAAKEDRVMVQDAQGNKFTLPRSQLKSAILQGYTELQAR